MHQAAVGAEEAPLVPKTAPVNYKNSVWNLGISFVSFNLTDASDTDNELKGIAGMVQLGIGKLFTESFLLASIDIVLGPYEPVREEEIKTDFSGTGASFLAGYNLSSGPLRKSGTSFGLSLGLDYSDLTGRSISRSSTDSDNRNIDSYVIRISSCTVDAGIFFSWLKPPRLEGNTPELLVTRIEGYILNLSVGYPVLTSYRADYDESTNGNSVKVRERGRLSGLTYLVSFIPILGI